MFTGIIQDIGEVTVIDRKGDWTLTVATNKFPLERTTVGDSIACNGVCLTVIDKETVAHTPKTNRNWFKAQVSTETLGCTTAKNWSEGTKLNLEHSLRMGDELGGHMVLGHVDGVAAVTNKHNDGDSLRFTLKVPHEHARFVAKKGSITLNGVSLTVNEVENDQFEVNIIPHTLQETALGSLKVGEEVNFEVDLIARYAARLLETKE